MNAPVDFKAIEGMFNATMSSSRSGSTRARYSMDLHESFRRPCFNTGLLTDLRAMITRSK